MRLIRILVFANLGFCNVFSNFLKFMMILRLGIHNRTQMAECFKKALELTLELKSTRSMGLYHLSKVFDDRLVVALKPITEEFRIEKFTARVFEASNYLIVDYQPRNSDEITEYELPAEFNYFLDDHVKRLFMDVIKTSKDFQTTSLNLYCLLMQVFATENRQGIWSYLLATAIRAYEWLQRIIFMYQKQLPELKQLHKFINQFNDCQAQAECMILLRMQKVKKLWTLLDVYDFSTAYPVVASSFMILQYSLFMSLLLNDDNLVTKALEYLEDFNEMLISKFASFKALKSMEHVGIKLLVVASSRYKIDNGTFYMIRNHSMKNRNIWVAITTDYQSSMTSLAKQLEQCAN